MFCQGDPDQLGVPTLNGDGRNLASILDIFLRRDRERFFRVRDILIKQVPGVEDINILTPAPDKRNINFTIDNGFEIDGNKTSVGVRLILFFIVLSNHPRPPKTILIEEPENGVHPGRLIEIIHMLRTLSEGKYGNCPTQIILSTHSPYLLDAVDLDQDQVLVFERGEQGDRHVKPVDKQKLKVFLDEFLLGEVWYNEGEKGLV
jgi:predicted ATPase